MIFVTVGTHELPFDRLVRAAASLAATGERVVVQRGTSREPAVGCEVHDHLPPDAWAARIAEARVVVCHAGPATLEAAVAAGRIPVVVPRRRLWREHVDDHQLAWARRIADRVHVVVDPDRLAAAVARHDAVVAALPRPWRAGVSGAWLAHLDALASAR